jgi:hypothetical protein
LKDEIALGGHGIIIKKKQNSAKRLKSSWMHG